MNIFLSKICSSTVLRPLLLVFVMIGLAWAWMYFFLNFLNVYPETPEPQISVDFRQIPQPQLDYVSINYVTYQGLSDEKISTRYPKFFIQGNLNMDAKPEIFQSYGQVLALVAQELPSFNVIFDSTVGQYKPFVRGDSSKKWGVDPVVPTASKVDLSLSRHFASRKVKDDIPQIDHDHIRNKTGWQLSVIDRVSNSLRPKPRPDYTKSNYFISVGFFAKSENAEKSLKIVRRLDVDVQIKKSVIGGVAGQLITLGPIYTRDRASIILDNVRRLAVSDAYIFESNK